MWLAGHWALHSEHLSTPPVCGNRKLASEVDSGLEPGESDRTQAARQRASHPPAPCHLRVPYPRLRASGCAGTPPLVTEGWPRTGQHRVSTAVALLTSFLPQVEEVSAGRRRLSGACLGAWHQPTPGTAGPDRKCPAGRGRGVAVPGAQALKLQAADPVVSHSLPGPRRSRAAPAVCVAWGSAVLLTTAIRWPRVEHPRKTPTTERSGSARRQALPPGLPWEPSAGAVHCCFPGMLALGLTVVRVGCPGSAIFHK